MSFDKKNFIEKLKLQIQNDYSQDIKQIGSYELYMSLSKLIRHSVSQRWIDFKKENEEEKNKQVYYFSMEFMTGKLLKTNLLKLGIYKEVKETLDELGFNMIEVLEEEREPGLGNGGLGRLASCFMDSMACLGIAGSGNGIRYDYGMFEQRFSDGNQIEWPDDWLRSKNPWEIRKDKKSEYIRFGGTVRLDENYNPVHEGYDTILAVPYDTPIIGNDGKTVNTLRLWSAELDMTSYELNHVEYQTMEDKKREIEKITNVLYPDDSTDEGKLLRLRQEYFFCSAGIKTIIKTFKNLGLPIENLPDKVAIHINDTHPTLCIPELIRILIDEEGLSWDEAVDITEKTISYTNHTIMQEALEKWPAHFMKNMIPRVYMIIEEIDRRFIEKYSSKISKQELSNTMIIKDGYVRMANLSVIKSHSVNGVARIHSEILKTETMKDLYKIYPDKFNNKTNGITFRRWIESANSELSSLIDNTLGNNWRKDPTELKKLNEFSDDINFLDSIGRVKLKNKEKFSDFIREKYGEFVDPTSIIDVQIKRIHEYKRQFMNALHILYLYRKLLNDSNFEMYPRTFVFGGKAASSYYRAKKIIKFINSLAYQINNDKRVNKSLKIFFVPNYNVSLAEKIIPAANVSEQISTASTEASGTSNMKFMLNGAITIATLDGANVEIKEEVGDENIVIFGMKKEEVLDLQKNGGYNASLIYTGDLDIKDTLDCLVNGFLPKLGYDGMDLYDSLLKENDRYFILKDFRDYINAQNRINELYKDELKWNKMSLINIANSGKFSSDNTIKQYANEIWKVKGSFN